MQCLPVGNNSPIANTFGTDNTNSQPIQPTSSTNMSASTQKMLRPMARDAPRFNGDKSENIRRFLLQMEDLFSDCSITDDAEKKKQLVRYADADTKEE